VKNVTENMQGQLTDGEKDAQTIKEKLREIKNLEKTTKDMTLEEIRQARIDALQTLKNLIVETLQLAHEADAEGREGNRPDKIRYLQLAGTLLKTQDDILTRVEDAKLSEEVDEVKEKQIRITERHK